MSAYHEMNRNALREHHQLERDTLDRVQAEAMRLERLPEGEEARDSTVLVDGELVMPTPRRIRGKLTVRW